MTMLKRWGLQKTCKYINSVKLQVARGSKNGGGTDSFFYLDVTDEKGVIRI